MNPEVQASVSEIIKKHGKAMATEIVVAVAFPALEAAVKASASPMDDVVLAALEAPLKKALADMIEKI